MPPTIPTPPASSAAAEFTIREVCDQTDLSPRTVRYYEEVGLLPGVRRRSGGRRVYGGDELERLRFIGRLKTLGLSLAEIKELNVVYAIGGSTAALLERLDGLLGARIGDLDGRIRELGALRDDMSKYRDHVCSRIDALKTSSSSSVSPPSASQASSQAPSQPQPQSPNGGKP
jgi:DNA-binding transcriptional MerR regulator